MTKNSASNSENWTSLPFIVLSTISQYLKSTDLIELSKLNKNYRSQLSFTLFKKINTLHFKQAYPEFDYENAKDKQRESKALVRRLRSDFEGKFHLVNEVVFRFGFCNHFAAKFFKFFPNISNIVVEGGYEYSFNNLAEISPKIKSLQHASLKFSLIKYKLLEKRVYQSFLYRLETINLEVSPTLVDLELPFDVIDSSFTNLKTLTIINNNMLKKLSNGLKSLTSVEFNTRYDFNLTHLSNFISNNPQLVKLSISTSNLNDNTINSILALQKLHKLELYANESRFTNKPVFSTENLSIKCIAYNCNISCRCDLEILDYCKRLEIFEISQFYAITALSMSINDINTEINTLLITNTLNYFHIVQILTQVKKFKQLKFRNGCKFSDIYSEVRDFEKCDWMPKYDYPNDTDEFTFIRKPN